jgi:hypothetical protein
VNHFDAVCKNRFYVLKNIFGICFCPRIFFVVDIICVFIFFYVLHRIDPTKTPTPTPTPATGDKSAKPKALDQEEQRKMQTELPLLLQDLGTSRLLQKFKQQQLAEANAAAAAAATTSGPCALANEDGKSMFLYNFTN